MKIITINSREKVKGNWVTCKYCSSKFKFSNYEDRNKWKSKKYICPFCSINYCILPPTERELRIIQDDYVTSNYDQRYLTKMFNLLSIYAESILKKTFMTNNDIVYQESIDVYARDAASFLMEKYKDKDFTINVSFGGFIIHKIKQALYNKKNHTCANETLNFRFADGHFYDREDKGDNDLDIFIQKQHKLDLCDYMTNLIFELESKCSSPRENRLRLTVIALFLERGEKFFDKFFNVWSRESGKWITQKSLDILHAELLHAYGERDYKDIISNVLNED